MNQEINHCLILHFLVNISTIKNTDLDIDPFSDENLVLIPLLVYEIEGV